MLETSKKTKQILGIMLAYSLAALIASFITGDLASNWQGFITIMTSPAQLTMDYFKLGTVGGTFLNVGLVGLGTTAVFALSGMAVNGASLMCYFLTIGFSFFGMNFLNMWPCILGTWIFTRVTKVKFAQEVNIALFATSLAPFVSEGIFRYPVFDGMPSAWVFKILFGILLGVIAGFMMPVLCKHSPNLHHGYTLYNAAAVAGFIGIMLFSTMFRAVGLEIPSNTDIGESYAVIGNSFAIITSLLAIVAGFFMNGKSFKGFSKIYKNTGYKCDFTQSAGVPVTLIHIGTFGLFVTAYYNLTGAALTGPTVGSIVSLLAITACGAHALNMLPIMIGYAIASTFCAFELNTQAIIVGLCFAGALIPVSGRFGTLSGIVVGLLHACMVTSVVTFHGGFVLYNGGFTCGIVAILMVPMLEYFFQPQDELKLFPVRKKD